MRASSVVVEAADVAAACAVLADGESVFDLIVVVAAYPGQVGADAIEQLRALAPLARLVGLLGPWCEGELRSGSPWPGALRVYWHQWAAQFGQEAGWLHQGWGSSWGLPNTASEEERVLAAAQRPIAQRQGQIAIYSGEFAMWDWLEAACRRAGYTAMWVRDPLPHAIDQPVAALFDGNDHPIQQYQQLRCFAQCVAPAPVVALLGFPRPEDCRQARANGAAAILSKPFSIQDLYWQLDELLGHGCSVQPNGLEAGDGQHAQPGPAPARPAVASEATKFGSGCF